MGLFGGTGGGIPLEIVGFLAGGNPGACGELVDPWKGSFPVACPTVASFAAFVGTGGVAAAITRFSNA